MELASLAVLVLGATAVVVTDGFVAVPSGPAVVATSGEVVPHPRRQVKTPSFFALRPSSFRFEATGAVCDVLLLAMARYSRLLQREASVGRGRVGRARQAQKAQRAGRRLGGVRQWRHDPFFSGNVTVLQIDVGYCEPWPYPYMDESYQLFIPSDPQDPRDPQDPDQRVRQATPRLLAPRVWGALRGLETFVQLLSPSGDGSSLLVNATTVVDEPRFPHRGLMLDTSRHFLPVDDIKIEMDGMEAVKMNVLHWHIVDDQSFPWQSSLYPELSERGAYDPSQTYSPQDVRDVIEYARQRGIRVMVELDSPGHTRSWGEGRPGLLAACHDSQGRPDGTFSNINPTRPENLDFLSRLFGEVAAAFPDPVLHLGGDEVPTQCWDSDPTVLAYMKQRGISGDFRRLQSEYLRWLATEVHRLNRTPVVWQEAWQNGDFHPEDVIVHIWLGNAMDLMSMVTRQGFRALLSETWYLDHLNTGWEAMYRVDPQNFDATAQQLRLVEGGEACMWAEMVDATNIHSRVWPRAAAVAERLWSPRPSNLPASMSWMGRRLEELVCRLRRRGVAASPPNGPGYCPS